MLHYFFQPSFGAEGQQRFTRLSIVGDGYCAGNKKGGQHLSPGRPGLAVLVNYRTVACKKQGGCF